ncbi:inositol monophosphatase [Candidatus Saccharibacteria bacterium]|nr:inositol monophosphatase [Candidatus Saccharibacteria bacterium]
MMLHEELEFAKKLALEAGEIMRKYFGKSPEPEFKEDDTIVTIADKEINQMVIDRIIKKYPEDGLDGEEQSHNKESDRLWVCDPIDGTNPFAMGLAVSVFSIALVIDGAPKLGVIYDFISDRLYHAQVGSGAFCNNDKISVSQEILNEKSRINFDWWPEAEYQVITSLVKLSKDKRVYLLSPGSTTHMAALVSRGEFVASIFSGTKGKNVDIAAAKVIVEEAGGKVTDLFGDEQRYDRDIKGAIVSNGTVHDEIVEYLKGDLL